MRALFMAVMALGFSCSVCAQVAELPSAADLQTLSCLQRGTSKLRYPERDLQLRSPGAVRLSLRFTAPDQRPEVAVLYRAASDAMVEEVEWHVRDYRLPCLSGAPVTAVQEFVFTPRATDPITWTPLRPTRDRDDTEQRMSCLRTPKEHPEFSGGMLQRDITNIFVDLQFSAPDAPPSVKLAYSNAGASQEGSVRDYVAQYRMPCLPSGAKPAVMRQHFQFRPYGVAKRVFKDAIALPAFLSNVKGIREQRATFDFNTMGCPFQVAWSLGKPKLDNRVGQIGKPDPNRTEFLVWLGGLEMDLKEAHFEQLVGQTLIVNVGCGKLELGG
ncbi:MULTISPECIES: hypothetical protein [unclassified Roseateles]|uniref:hypothetical protein n=1 Tax=unclassified Roseateles TaxID=2626991 RepID=UPI0007148222|nr:MULTISPECIES: hypothetical protein [unclassified Roseateles]KQW45791.1 hypothetical protein ASC81_12970 [Pelomonas sp. Root405]KRA72635.1 hypothetical protein ASD88_12970 [Pelomonas sp. Root662]